MRAAALTLAGWTLFVWATRIRNALGDDDLAGGDKAFAVGIAVLFTFGGLAVLVAALRRSHLHAAVRGLAAVTAVYWPIRVVQIVFAGHGAAFTLVHTVLGVVSVSLALWAWMRSSRSPSRATGAIAV